MCFSTAHNIRQNTFFHHNPVAFVVQQSADLGQLAVPLDHVPIIICKYIADIHKNLVRCSTIVGVLPTFLGMRLRSVPKIFFSNVT